MATVQRDKNNPWLFCLVEFLSKNTPIICILVIVEKTMVQSVFTVQQMHSVCEIDANKRYCFVRKLKLHGSQAFKVSDVTLMQFMDEWINTANTCMFCFSSSGSGPIFVFDFKLSPLTWIKMPDLHQKALPPG